MSENESVEPVVEARDAAGPGTVDRANLERLLDLEFPIIVVLAEKKMALEEILGLSEGDVIPFKKHNSEPLDLLVNDARIGSGKTIKAGERFGLHVRAVGPPRETLKKIMPQA